jgi:molybdopterin-guanine dinucleotide biosynthesis protein
VQLIADHDVVLTEGFRELGWPKLSISDNARPTVEELAANLDRIWSP